MKERKKRNQHLINFDKKGEKTNKTQREREKNRKKQSEKEIK